jgi:hypothetical protein
MLGSEQPGSFEHSDFQQEESRNCWGVESLGVVGQRILIQLAVASVETEAK